MGDAPLAAHEHLEHAEHAAHAGDPFISLVSITIAVLAVVAAAAASLETVESSSAITSASKAVLAQDQATDNWNFYEAKSLKKNLYAIAADQGGPKAADYAKKAKSEGDGQDQAQADAKRLEGVRDEALKASDTHEGRHHRLTIGATMLEIAIALATIAIVTKRRWPWMIAVGLGAIGAVVAALAYIG
ncbi:MAG TPA: DUF4337 family protein [Caulobacteraceae bacterium]|nr:DUF4337 family protein [Caulobacteraceae bacterium]